MKLVCLLQCNLVIVSVSIVITTVLRSDLSLIHLLCEARHPSPLIRTSLYNGMNRGAQELFAYENLIKLQTAIEQHIQW